MQKVILITIYDKLNAFSAIKTERLTIRKFNPKDMDCIKEAFAKVSFRENMLIKDDNKVNYSCFDYQKMLAHYENTQVNVWAVCDNKTDDCIGSVSIQSHDNISNSVEIGYWISDRYANKGYGTEAVKAVVKFCFEYACIHRVWAMCRKDNKASIKLLMKAGFKPEGLMQDAVFYNNSYIDIAYLAILNY